MKKHIFKFCIVGILLCFTACGRESAGIHEYKFEAQPVDLQITPDSGGYKVEGFSAFQVDNHFVWGASVTKAEDGKYYMIYSAFVDNFVSRSSILL